MTMSLQQIRDFVRTHLDLEVDDLPDDLLDTFIRDGSRRIERAEGRWPFYEQTYPLTTSPTVDTYAKTTIGADLDQIQGISVNDRRLPLSWIGMDELTELQTTQPTMTSRPVYFSEWNGSVVLFPIPDIAYNLTVRAFRKATDWVTAGAGALPDMPDELHNTVATFALAKSYAQQEDPEMSAIYERQFTDELEEYMRRLAPTPYSQPLILNGGPRSRSGSPQRAGRPWYSYAGGIF